jgi:asparagine synthase (glutamine-hydrolysing)
MCGIAVSIGHLDLEIEAAVERMSSAQLHRGPDAGGRWRSNPAPRDRGVVLAHRRLAIVDLSEAANQPMHDEETGNVLVFNGEIYGFEELRDELAALGVRFRTRSDTEVLLRAYAVWGAQCVERLRGMFAIALWDARRQVLFLARDRMGIKPLYYARVVDEQRRATLYCASELRALLASGRLERRISPAALASYAWNGFVNGDQALVLGVRELPAGTWAEVSLEGELPQPRPYWRVPLPQGEGRDDLDELRAELERATRQHLVSDVPVGVFLSGGIDSSAVSALAARAGKGPICTFTITFDDPQFDESRYARQVAERLGTQHREILLTEAAFGPSSMRLSPASTSRASTRSTPTSSAAPCARRGSRWRWPAPAGRALRRLPQLPGDPARQPRGALRALRAGRAARRAGANGDARGDGRGRCDPAADALGKLEDALGSGGGLVDVYQVSYGLFSGAFFPSCSIPTSPARPCTGSRPSGARRCAG